MPVFLAISIQERVIIAHLRYLITFCKVVSLSLLAVRQHFIATCIFGHAQNYWPCLRAFFRFS